MTFVKYLSNILFGYVDIGYKILTPIAWLVRAYIFYFAVHTSPGYLLKIYYVQLNDKY